MTTVTATTMMATPSMMTEERAAIKLRHELKHSISQGEDLVLPAAEAVQT